VNANTAAGTLKRWIRLGDRSSYESPVAFRNIGNGLAGAATNVPDNLRVSMMAVLVPAITNSLWLSINHIEEAVFASFFGLVGAHPRQILVVLVLPP